MKKVIGPSQILIIIAVFVFPRMLALYMGLHMNPKPLYIYWQYLDGVGLQ